MHADLPRDCRFCPNDLHRARCTRVGVDVVPGTIMFDPPIPFDENKANEAISQFSGHGQFDQLKAIAGCSPYIGSILRQDGSWLLDNLEITPEGIAQHMMQGCRLALPLDCRVGMRNIPIKGTPLSSITRISGTPSGKIS